jgi:hypothetical protein
MPLWPVMEIVYTIIMIFFNQQEQMSTSSSLSSPEESNPSVALKWKEPELYNL